MFFGIAVFDFEGNNIVLNVHRAMVEPQKIGRVLVGVLIVYIAMLASFSAIAYSSFGDAIQDMVTLNLPHDRLTATLQIFYSLGLLGSYPIQMLPYFEIVEKSMRYTKA
jgi:amino acid permease